MNLRARLNTPFSLLCLKICYDGGASINKIVVKDDKVGLIAKYSLKYL